MTNVFTLTHTLEHEATRGLALRRAVAERLSEVVAWPQSRITAHERQLAGDVLVGLLSTLDVDIRLRCAERLAQLVEAPMSLARYLAQDDVQVAAPLLSNSSAFDESDLVAVIRAATPAHAALIAARRGLGPCVGDAIVAQGDDGAIAALLANKTARLSHAAVNALVRRSRQRPALAAGLLQRSELKPAQGLTLFWWADHAARASILQRFAVDRAVLVQELADLFVRAAELGWSDSEARKALQFIERRQRSRAAAARSQYGSLEGAISAAREQGGVDRALAAELAHLAGVRPQAGARILLDPGGEPIAVLAKACGLKRGALVELWLALGRAGDAEDPASPLARTVAVFETLAVAKAQTVLRYWNWSLTSDRGGGPAGPDDLSLDLFPARRVASLVDGDWG